MEAFQELQPGHRYLTKLDMSVYDSFVSTVLRNCRALVTVWTLEIIVHIWSPCSDHFVLCACSDSSTLSCTNHNETFFSPKQGTIQSIRFSRKRVPCIDLIHSEVQNLSNLVCRRLNIGTRNCSSHISLAELLPKSRKISKTESGHSLDILDRHHKYIISLK